MSELPDRVLFSRNLPGLPYANTIRVDKTIGFANRSADSTLRITTASTNEARPRTRWPTAISYLRLSLVCFPRRRRRRVYRDGSRRVYAPRSRRRRPALGLRSSEPGARTHVRPETHPNPSAPPYAHPPRQALLIPPPRRLCIENLLFTNSRAVLGMPEQGGGQWRSHGSTADYWQTRTL